MRFLHAEGYHSGHVMFQLPSVHRKHLHAPASEGPTGANNPNPGESGEALLLIF